MIVLRPNDPETITIDDFLGNISIQVKSPDAFFVMTLTSNEARYLAQSLLELADNADKHPLAQKRRNTDNDSNR